MDSFVPHSPPVFSHPPVQRQTLANGIPLLTERLPYLRSVTLGVWINTGSRDELPHEHGISHFLEHTFFKGTARRSAQQIAQEIDALGGELNAFTSREQTAFYIQVLSDRLEQGADLLMDILTQATFDAEELDRERQVIVEEIRMVEDEAEEWVHDLHSAHMWGTDTPLGRPILGTEASVRGFNRDQIDAYLKRRYTADRVVISAAGNLDPNALYQQLGPYMDAFPAPPATVNTPTPPSAQLHHQGPQFFHRKLEQSHLCIGGAGLPLGHADRFGMYVLNDLLGGGSSSRLFQEIREKRGLAYSVYSGHTGYRDCGETTIYAGCGPESLDQVFELAQGELTRLRTEPVGDEELTRIKGHLSGTLMLSLEGSFNRMSRLAQDEFQWQQPQALDAILTGIDTVNAEQIMRLAEQSFPDGACCSTVLGSVKATTG